MAADPVALKSELADAIAASADDLNALAADLFECAELGFREVRTAERIQRELATLGMDVHAGLGMTGLRATLGSGVPTVALLGELDGLPAPGGGEDEFGGPRAAHICGHHAQLVHVVAVARAFSHTGVMESLEGSVAFIATPAEEYVDLDWRLDQVAQGRIESLSGKQEMVRLGTFDDVDMALIVHATGRPENRRLSTHSGSNGVIGKRARFLGHAAHAADAPHVGINALNAATLAMTAIQYQRETFRDEDRVRVHGIITEGGKAPNVIPAEVALEVFARGSTQAALDDAAQKVDRSLRAGAVAIGAGLRVETLPGYLPLRQSASLTAAFAANARALVGDEGFADLGPTAVSTDVGDLSHLIPVVHGFHGGFVGENHEDNFRMDDPHEALVTPATAIAWTIVDLLANGASRARQVVEEFTPAMTTEDYLTRLRSLATVTELSAVSLKS